MGLHYEMSKAHDRIEWCFLKVILRAMNFPDNWVSLILRCVSSVSFSILLNDNPCNKFFPQRFKTR